MGGQLRASILLNILTEAFVLVGDIIFLPHVYRNGYGRARLFCTHIWYEIDPFQSITLLTMIFSIMSGGLYYWTYQFSSPRFRDLLSWIVGYTNTISYIAGLSGIDWACAVQVMAGVSISSDETFIPTVYQTL